MANWENENEYKIYCCDEYSNRWEVIGKNGWIAGGDTLQGAIDNLLDELPGLKIAEIRLFVEKRSEIITLEYVQLYDELETDKVWCFRFDDDNVGERIWLPKFQVKDIRESCNEVDVPLWLAGAKELKDYAK